MTINVVFTEGQKRMLLKWAEWLDTTTYSRGTSALHPRKDRFCCLGIYAVNLCPHNWDGKNLMYEDTPYDVLLPDELSALAGIDQRVWSEHSLEYYFVIMNDNLRYSFKMIAVEIRSLVECGRFTEETQKKLEKHQ